MNPRAGGERAPVEELAAAARKLAVSVHVLDADDDPAELAREVAAETLGIAGGDGSLAPVAEVAVERELPFVCVPLGTRNHFARDLGVDRRDPLGAIAAFAGRERRVDVGRVEERVFLNNVAIGAYARLVHGREEHRHRRDAFARVRALAMVVRHPQPLRVSVDGRPVRARVLLVANNHYELQLLSLGARERLDDGLLHLYAAEGVLPDTWDERTAARFRLESPEGILRAAMDGEPVMLRTPAEFRIEPRALRVLLPRYASG